MRSDCMHCGTALVRVLHWGVCPVCSKDYLAAATRPPKGYRLVREPDQELARRGAPDRRQGGGFD